MASLAGQPPATEPASAAGGTIQIPVRWCALKGTLTVTNPQLLGELTTDRVLLKRLQGATSIWAGPNGANIILRSAITAALPTSSASFPVIDDPRPPPGGGPVEQVPGVPESPGFPPGSGPGNGPGQLGDILWPIASKPEEMAQHREAEWEEAYAECQEEWDHLAGQFGTPLRGPIAFNMRQFVNADGTPRPLDLGLGDFTRTPSSVMHGECSNPPNIDSADGGFMGLFDLVFIQPQSLDPTVVAHEFGHILQLGHGNGLDDNGNGVYDQFCDSSENPLASPATLMHPNANMALPTLTQLQRTTARGIAMKYSGSQIDPPFGLVPGDTRSDQRVDDALDVQHVSLDMTGVGMAVNAERKRVILSHTLHGLVPKRISGTKMSPTSYVAFLDLDANRATGGRPAGLGFRTRFRGAELVTRVLVKGRRATPTVWRFDRDRFTNVTGRRVRATVSSPVGDEVPFPIFDVVSAELPAKMVGRVGSRVRLQAIAAGKGKWVDVLPGERRVSRRARPKRSVRLSMFHPNFPACTTRPEVVRPGDVVTIKAAGFKRRDEEVQVMLGDQVIANLELDGRGNMSTRVAIPETTSEGPHAITVMVENTALTADCVLQVRT